MRVRVGFPHVESVGVGELPRVVVGDPGRVRATVLEALSIAPTPSLCLLQNSLECARVPDWLG